MATDTNLNIVVSLKDQASADLKKVGENVAAAAKKSSDSFTLTGNSANALAHTLEALAVGAGVAVVGFLYSSVKAAGEAQVAMAKVDATLKVMGKSAQDNRAAIVAAAQAAVRLGFDDEDAAQSITKFYQRTKDLTESIKLNNLAMDLARAKNIDLQSAVNLVNLAISGSGRALLAYGIHIKDAATPLEALQELQGQVAGQADAFSKTFEGQMQVLSVSFQNIKEVIGGALIEALLPFIQQFTAWLNNPVTQRNIDHWTVEFKSWADVIIPALVDTFKMWVDWAQKAFDIIIKIGDALERYQQKASSFAASLNNAMKGSLTNAGSNIIWALQGMPAGRATGGPVAANTAYVVGERGPELFMPGSNGTIIPNMSSISSGGQTVNISIGSLYGTDEAAAMKFAALIMDRLGSSVKLRTI